MTELTDALDHDQLDNLEFVPLVLYEALRFEPPASTAVRSYVTQDAKLGGLNVRKGDLFMVLIYGLHHNPNEWIEPGKFIPERFDPASPYALTPKGEKRDPFSFVPFIGGKRVCLGKTLADLTAKIAVSAFLHSFDFAFEDEKHMTEFAIHNIMTSRPAPVFVKATPTTHF